VTALAAAQVVPNAEDAALEDAEFKRGWRVVAASLLGLMFSQATIHSSTLGVLTPELSRAFGWSRSEVQASFAALTISAMLSAPVAGMLVNRLGPRRVLLISVPCLSLTFMAFAFMTGSLLQFYAISAVSACLGAGTLPMAYAKVVTSWFPKKTGLALAIAMLGPGLLSTFSIPLIMWIVGAFGWRAVYIIVGAMPLVMFPIVWAWLKEEPTRDRAVAAPPERTGSTLFEALREWRLWVMALAFLLSSGSITGCLTNLPTLLSDSGLKRSEIMMVAPALGACALVGRIVGGRFLDRWWAPAVAFVFLSLLAGGLALLGRAQLSPMLAASALALIGLSSGVENDVLAYMVSRYFGLRAYGSVYGVLFMASGVGGGFSPIIFSIGRDQTGSFQIVLYAACVIIALAGAALLTLGRYRYFRRTA
jgi:predicted MFS family arabinose efflux permease